MVIDKTTGKGCAWRIVSKTITKRLIAEGIIGKPIARKQTKTSYRLICVDQFRADCDVYIARLRGSGLADEVLWTPSFIERGIWERAVNRFHHRDVGSMVQGRQYTPSHRSKKREPIPQEDWVVVPNMHEPIISRELFDEAQAKLKTRKKVCEGPSDLPHLFSGLFFCEACGSSMRLGYTQKRKYIYYSCARSTAIGSIACSTHYINFNTLYQVVQEDIKRNAILFSEDYEQATKRLMELKCADEQKQASKMQRELASAEKRLAELDVKLKRAYEDNINGKLPDHIFSMFISDYDAEKATLKATIADMRKSLEKVKDTAADIDRFAKLIQKYTSFEELDRFMLNELIDRITIYETPGMGRYRKGKEKIITIYYKFVGTLQ